MKPTDLTPSDIFVEEFTALDGTKGFRATLGFIIYQGGVKMYQATGVTREEAVKALGAVMVDHITKATS